jgi:hypothetical protein
MRKVIDFFKRSWLLILIVLAIFLFIADKIIKPKTSGLLVSPTPISTGVADYKSIVPGKSTLDEVNDLLGFPIEQNEENGKTIAEYESSSKYRNNVITVQNGVTTLIKEIVTATDNKKAESVTGVYGTAPHRLYEQKPSSTFDLYVYPNNGIAYLGHEDGTLLEIWYFQPTTIETFSNSWGQGYSTRPSTKQNPY